MSFEKRSFETVAGIRDGLEGLEHLNALLAFEFLNPGLLYLISRFGETIKRPDGVPDGNIPQVPIHDASVYIHGGAAGVFQMKQWRTTVILKTNQSIFKRRSPTA